MTSGEKLYDILNTPKLKTFCFISFDDYEKNLNKKIKEFYKYTGDIVHFNPKYAITHTITKPKYELYLLTKYLKHNLEHDEYNKIKKGFNVIILIDEKSSCECQILAKEDEYSKMDGYIDNHKIDVYNYVIQKN